MNYEKIQQLNVEEIVQLIKTKKITCVELTTACIKNCNKNANNAFNFFDESLAISQAEKIDKLIESGNTEGRLLGIPIAIKDNICTLDMPTTCSSNMLKKYYPKINATVVKKLMSEGAVIIGKANMDEFAMGSANITSAFGAVKNPVNTECVPGGSSGGSAASVAEGSSILSVGSDTGGSIRQPAAFCGVVGIKPTYGRISRQGMFPFASSLDQIGCFSKSVKDTALLCRCMFGYDENDETSANVPNMLNDDCFTNVDKKIKIAYYKQSFDDRVEIDIRDNFKNTLSFLTTNGFNLTEIDFTFAEVISGLYTVLSSGEAVANLAKFDGVRYGNKAGNSSDYEDILLNSRSKNFGREVRRRLIFGNFVLSDNNYSKYYEQAMKVRTLVINYFEDIFKQFDLVICPSTATTAPYFNIAKSADSLDFSDVFVIPANLTGFPSISIPNGVDSNALPIGLQIMSRRFNENALFKFANYFEENKK